MISNILSLSLTVPRIALIYTYQKKYVYTHVHTYTQSHIHYQIKQFTGLVLLPQKLFLD